MSWEAKQRGPGWYIKENGTGENIAQISGATQDTIRLIVQAPDMLGTLETLLEFVEETETTTQADVVASYSELIAFIDVQVRAVVVEAKEE